MAPVPTTVMVYSHRVLDGKATVVARTRGRNSAGPSGDEASARARARATPPRYPPCTRERGEVACKRRAAPPPSRRAASGVGRWAQVDVDEANDTKTMLKQRLSAATGIPATEISVMLGGYRAITAIDKQCNILKGSCGQSVGARARSHPRTARCAARLVTRARALRGRCAAGPRARMVTGGAAACSR